MPLLSLVMYWKAEILFHILSDWISLPLQTRHLVVGCFPIYCGTNKGHHPGRKTWKCNVSSELWLWGEFHLKTYPVCDHVFWFIFVIAHLRSETLSVADDEENGNGFFLHLKRREWCVKMMTDTKIIIILGIVQCRSRRQCSCLCEQCWLQSSW